MPARRVTEVSEHHDCIVVGAGVLGLSAAWALSRRGLQVLVLEGDAPGHEGSGSKGNARIFRLSYPDRLYVELAVGAKAMWEDLERESNLPLFLPTGLLSFGPGLESLGDAMSGSGASCTLLARAEIRQRFPQLEIDGPALLDDDAGVLAADACLEALIETGSFRLRPDSSVLSVHNGTQSVTLALDDDTVLSADVVVNCAGPRALSLLDTGRVRVAASPTLQQVVYLSSGQPGHPVPCFIEWGDDMVYGLPVAGEGLLKLSHHALGPSVDVDDVEFTDDPRLVEALLDVARRLLPAFEHSPVRTERCLYDNTVDSDFIIDRIGRIVIGCGTSGHGFKFAPLLGQLMADLALGEATRYDLSRFAANRSFLRAMPNP